MADNRLPKERAQMENFMRIRLPLMRELLQSADNLPAINKIRNNAEAVRAAARSLGVSVPSINAWTMFQVDAEREGAKRIDQMREDGELAEHGGDRKSTPATRGLIGLSDLIPRRATQRAHEWAMLALLSQIELDAEENQANEIGKPLSHNALIKLGAAKITKQRRDESRGAEPLPDGVELRIGDCRIVLADVPDNSVPLILTDPPYGDEAEPLYHWLAQWAARVLIPGGSLVCYTGQSRLNRDISIFDQQLRYWWLLIMLHDQSQRLPGKFVIANFKPVLWYVKQFRRGRTLMPDILRSIARDKETHDWGQGQGGITQIVEHLTHPSELIVDPFAGTATWGRICAEMGRCWLGADVIEGGSAETVATSGGEDVA
jgi:hypothetical protein